MTASENSLPEVVLGCFLHFLQYHGRNFLRRIKTVINLNTWCVIVASGHFVGTLFISVPNLVKVSPMNV